MDAVQEKIKSAKSVYIANFGVENSLWDACRKNSTVATFELAPAYEFSSKNDKEGYIRYSLANVKSSRGTPPLRQVASRWYGISKIVEATEGDIWLHVAGDDVWWTVTKELPFHVDRELSGDRANPNVPVVILQKPAIKWMKTSLLGTRLSWSSLHRKVQNFLLLQGTLRELSEDNAAYIKAMLMGQNLQQWHDLTQWKDIQSKSGKGAVSFASLQQNAAYRMAMTAWGTTQYASGQEVIRKIKNKEFRFPSQVALEAHITTLLEAQEGLCALSGLEMQFDGAYEDEEMLCSLDRIDSSGHYEEGNLQVVCRFLNRWKSDSDNVEFRRLLTKLRNL